MPIQAGDIMDVFPALYGLMHNTMLVPDDVSLLLEMINGNINMWDEIMIASAYKKWCDLNLENTV